MRHAVLALVLTACLPPQDCTPHSQSCDPSGVPRTCSSTGRGWLASGAPAVRCAEIGGSCEVRNGRVGCYRMDAAVLPTGTDASVDGP